MAEPKRHMDVLERVLKRPSLSLLLESQTR